MKYQEINAQTFDMQNYAGVSFLGTQLENSVFINCNFDEALLTGTMFTKCNFFGCSFNKTYIFRSQFKQCELVDCSFQDAMLSTVDFPSTSFLDVTWQGHKISAPPLIIEGIPYPVVALDNGHMHVGCEYNTYEWFFNTDEKHSASMEGLKARRFWKKYKKPIFDLLAARGFYDTDKNT